MLPTSTGRSASNFSHDMSERIYYGPAYGFAEMTTRPKWTVSDALNDVKTSAQSLGTTVKSTLTGPDCSSS